MYLSCDCTAADHCPQGRTGHEEKCRIYHDSKGSLVRALANAVDSLEYVQTAYPDISGYGVRAERIKEANTLLGQ